MLNRFNIRKPDDSVHVRRQLFYDYNVGPSDTILCAHRPMLTFASSRSSTHSQPARQQLP